MQILLELRVVGIATNKGSEVGLKKVLLIIIIATVLSVSVGTVVVTDEAEVITSAETKDMPAETEDSSADEAVITTASTGNTEISQTTEDKPTEESTQTLIETESEKQTEHEENSETTEELQECSETMYSASDFQVAGVIYWGEWKWTYYSEKVLPGHGLDIPGRHTDSNGYVCDEDGYICVASSVLSYGTVIETPFGKNGKVYDSGCASNVIDVYVSW